MDRLTAPVALSLILLCVVVGWSTFYASETNALLEEYLFWAGKFKYLFLGVTTSLGCVLLSWLLVFLYFKIKGHGRK